MNILGMTLSLALLTLSLLHYSSLIKEVRRAEARTKTYLCLRHVVEKTKSQIKTQNRFDFAIGLINKAMVPAVLKPALLANLKKKKQWVIRSSQVSYAYFLTRLAPLKWCGLKNSSLIFNTPFQTKGTFLARSSRGISLRKPTWAFTIASGDFFLRGQRHKKTKKGKAVWKIREI